MAPRLRLSYILFITLTALFSIQPSATAHVGVVSTSPQENSTVEQLPARVSIEFNEALLIIEEAKPNSLTVTSQSGAAASIGEPQVKGSTLSIAIDQSLTARDIFTVSYRVVSRDGHRVSGGYAFTLEPGATESPGSAPIQVPDDGQSRHNSLPPYGVLAAFALLALGAWALYRARFAHRK